jgi:hypothetical protein
MGSEETAGRLMTTRTTTTRSVRLRLRQHTVPPLPLHPVPVPALAWITLLTQWRLSPLTTGPAQGAKGLAAAAAAAAAGWAGTPQMLSRVALPGGGGGGGGGQQGGRARAVVCGANHSLAVSEDGLTLWGWGSNEHGQLSDRATTPAATPVGEGGCSVPAVIGGLGLRPGEEIVRVSAGYAHSAVLTDRGRVLTFGRGENGQLASGQAEDRSLPAEVMVTAQDWTASLACQR